MKKHPLANCEECPLYEESGVCPSSGNLNAHVAFVGEAPGFNEIKDRKPFVGVSGKLLRKVLQHHKINANQVFFTNTVLCRPEGNDDPPKEAIEACKPRLMAELDEVNPSTIVVLGNTAASVILERKTKITQERVGPPSFHRGRRVIPTIHPAAVLRSPDNFPHLVNDIGKISATNNHFVWPDIDISDDPDAALDALWESGHEIVALDLEVESEKDSDASIAVNPTIISASLSVSRDESIVFGFEAMQDQQFRRKFGEFVDQRKIICHNGKYDLQVLMRAGIIEEPKLYFDTMLASYCLDERPGVHSLKYLAKERLGAPNWDEDLHNKYGSWDSIFEKITSGDVQCAIDTYTYNAVDSSVTYHMYEILNEELDDQRQLHEMLCEFSDFLCHLESKGWVLDKEYLDHLEDSFKHQIEDTEDSLKKWVDNPRSPKQVKEALIDLGQTKVPSTDKEHLVHYGSLAQRKLDSGYYNDPKLSQLVAFTELMLSHRKVSKIQSTYIDGLRKLISPDGMIRTTINLHSTTTGRTSSRRPNLQNQPRESGIRNAFKCPPGYKVLHADYDGIELRVVTTESKSDSLRQIMAEGRKVHAELAETIYGTDFSKEDYVKAKSVVHGVNYARTPHGISDGLGIPLTEAQHIFDTYASMCPELFEWQKYIHDQVFKKHNTLVTPFGRKRRFHLITRDNKEDVYKEALAFKPQSIASDINMNAALRLHRARLDVRHVIHDAVIVFAKEDEVQDTVALMRPIMEQTAVDLYTDFVPFPVEVEVGTSYGELVTA